jgi:hypothetical protein
MIIKGLLAPITQPSPMKERERGQNFMRSTSVSLLPHSIVGEALLCPLSHFSVERVRERVAVAHQA